MVGEFLVQDKEVILDEGKKAVFGKFNLRILLWIEKKYGTLDQFMIKLGGRDTISDKIEVMFHLLKNKTDFKDMEDFAGYCSIQNLIDMAEILTNMISSSMPENKEPSEDTGEKKQTGEISSV